MDKEKIMEGVKLILEGIGEDPTREGLLETPDRIARMYEELAGGYTDSAADHLRKRFHVDNNDMVIEKDIHFYSFCEHHMLPFYGTAADRLYSERRGGRTEQDRTDRGSVCEAPAAAGASDGTDRGCFYGRIKAAGCDGTH